MKKTLILETEYFCSKVSESIIISAAALVVLPMLYNGMLWSILLYFLVKHTLPMENTLSKFIKRQISLHPKLFNLLLNLKKDDSEFDVILVRPNEESSSFHISSRNFMSCLCTVSLDRDEIEMIGRRIGTTNSFYKSIEKYCLDEPGEDLIEPEDEVNHYGDIEFSMFIRSPKGKCFVSVFLDQKAKSPTKIIKVGNNSQMDESEVLRVVMAKGPEALGEFHPYVLDAVTRDFV